MDLSQIGAIVIVKCLAINLNVRRQYCVFLSSILWLDHSGIWHLTASQGIFFIEPWCHLMRLLIWFSMLGFLHELPRVFFPGFFINTFMICYLLGKKFHSIPVFVSQHVVGYWNIFHAWLWSKVDWAPLRDV